MSEPLATTTYVDDVVAGRNTIRSTEKEPSMKIAEMREELEDATEQLVQHYEAKTLDARDDHARRVETMRKRGHDEDADEEEAGGWPSYEDDIASARMLGVCVGAFVSIAESLAVIADRE